MSRWVRLWEDMPTDPKWRAIARESECTVSDVIAVFVFMMVRASNVNERDETQSNAHERGELVNWRDYDVAAALDLEEESISRIFESMQGKVLIDHKLIGWEKRQPLRDDGSSERAKRWRERKRTQKNAPETETETDLLFKKKKQKTRASESAIENPFKDFWDRNPNKVGKAAARKSFSSALKRSSVTEIMDGLDRYVRDKPPDRQWCNPATWLNQDRWMDQPAIAGKMNGHAGQSKVCYPLIFVAEDTPQWEAWDAFYRTTKGTSPPKTNRGHTFERGWHFPTEWPPEEPKHDAG